MTIWYDEAGDLSHKAFRAIRRRERQKRAGYGWFNWYINRGHLSISTTTDSDLRRLSWRRKF